MCFDRRLRVSIIIWLDTPYITVTQCSVFARRGSRFKRYQEEQKAIFHRVESSFVFALPSKFNGSRNTEAELLILITRRFVAVLPNN